MTFKKIAGLLLSVIGIITPTTIYAEEIKSINETDPVILQHSQEFQHNRAAIVNSPAVANNENVELNHYSHYSSHYSHSSHNSHRSHYSSRY